MPNNNQLAEKVKSRIEYYQKLDDQAQEFEKEIIELLKEIFREVLKSWNITAKCFGKELNSLQSTFGGVAKEQVDCMLHVFVIYRLIDDEDSVEEAIAKTLRKVANVRKSQGDLMGDLDLSDIQIDVAIETTVDSWRTKTRHLRFEYMIRELVNIVVANWKVKVYDPMQ